MANSSERGTMRMARNGTAKIAIAAVKAEPRRSNSATVATQLIAHSHESSL